MAHQAALYPCPLNSLLPNRHFAAAAAAAKSARKNKKGAKEKTSDEKPVDDIEKIKSYTYMESEPEDDVYLKRLYPRRIYDVEKAIHLLKKFQVLDFTNPKQGVYLDLTLDMALGKKKKVEPFASVIALPHPFSSEVKKVAVFTGNASEIKIAEENGAAFAGGADLVKKILDDEVVVDFYVAVPEIMGELNPLRKKLKKRFPKATRNSIGRDIPKMLELFKTAHEIMVDEERQNFLSTKIATLATHPASCVKGRALTTAQAVGLPTCYWLGAASPSVQRPTLTRKVLVQSATHHAGSAMGLWNRTVYPVTLTLLSPVGAVRPAARMSNS